MSQLSDKEKKSEIERIVDLDRMGADGTAARYRRQRRRAGGAGQALRFSRPAGLCGPRHGRSPARRPGRGRGPAARKDRAGLRFDPGSGDPGPRRHFPHRLQEGPGRGARPRKRRGGAERPRRRARAACREICSMSARLSPSSFPWRPIPIRGGPAPSWKTSCHKPRGGRPQGPAEQRRHPFAGLAALRDKPRRGR